MRVIVKVGVGIIRQCTWKMTEGRELFIGDEEFSRTEAA